MSFAEALRESFALYPTPLQGILAVLHREHERMGVTIAAILATEDQRDDDRQRERMFEELRGLVLPHTKAEEDVFYARIEEESEIRALALAGRLDLQLVRRFVEELDVSTKQEERWMTRFRVLAEALRRHVREEERELFPRARRALTAAELDGLVASYEAARDRHARESGRT